MRNLVAWGLRNTPLVWWKARRKKCASLGYVDQISEDFVGQQQNWPNSPGTFVNNTYEIPTYFGYPPRPYNVIGYLDATTAPIRHRGVVAFAARRAKELGAAAIIVLSHGTEYAGTISTGSTFTSGQFYGCGVAHAAGDLKRLARRRRFVNSAAAIAITVNMTHRPL